MNKLALAVSVAVGLGLHSAAYADATVPVFAASTHAYGTSSHGQTSADGNRQFIGCVVYPNVTRNAYTAIECRAHSAAGGNFWCYRVNPDPAMLSAVTSVNENELSFLLVGSDSQNHCTYVTATALSESADERKQHDALQAIDASIARGAWGIEEYLGFHDKLGILDQPQAELAMQKLASAIRRGNVDAVLSAN